MKKIKRMLMALAALVLCIVPILSTPITAQAAEPVTYWLRYVPEKGEWRFQTGGWVENGYHRELYYMHQDISFPDLIQGTFEGFHQLMRKFSYESNGVAEKKWNIFYDHFSHCSIKSCE